MPEATEIQALIHLLDDNDHEVYKHVYNKLLSYGTQVIPTLENAWSDVPDPIIHERLEEIIHQIQWEDLLKEFTEWLHGETNDLLTGFYLVSKYFYPELKFAEVHKEVQKLKQRIWLELNFHQTPLEQINIFNQVFYDTYKYKALNPITETFQDYCLNQIMETRKGNAISLGLLYQIVANELDLPIYGVTLPKHYVLAACKHPIPDFTLGAELEKEIIFYINPVNKGALFSRNEIKDYLSKINEDPLTDYFIPSPNLALIRELTYSVSHFTPLKEDSDKAKEFAELTALIDTRL